MSMTNLNVRTDKELKEQAEDIFKELGLNMTTATTAFLKQVVLCRGIPFPLYADPIELRLDEADAEALHPGPRLTHEEFFRQARARIDEV